MENVFDKIEGLVSHIKEYTDNRLSAIKLSIAEKTSGMLSAIMGAIAVILVMFFCIVFASVALALVLSAWIGKMYAGFLIVAGLYFLAGIIIWAAKDKIIRMPIMNAMIKKMFNKNEEI